MSILTFVYPITRHGQEKRTSTIAPPRTSSKKSALKLTAIVHRDMAVTSTPAVFNNDSDNDFYVDEEEEQDLIHQEEDEKEGRGSDRDGDKEDDMEEDFGMATKTDSDSSEGSDDSLPERVMIRIIPQKRNKQPNPRKPKSKPCHWHPLRKCVLTLHNLSTEKTSVVPIPYEEEEVSQQTQEEEEVIPQIDYRILIFSLEELVKAAS